MSACILTRLFLFHMHKSNKINILVQELDHLLTLSYFDNFLSCSFSQCLHC